MPTSESSTIHEMWDGIYGGNHYDPLLQLSPYREQIEDTINAARPSADDSILDAGCGTGNVTAALAAFSPKSIVGIDRSAAMIDQARSKFPKLCFDFSDLCQSLSYMDDVFTLITAGNVIYTLSDQVGALQELKRTLVDGGRLVLTTPKDDADVGLILKAHCKCTKSDGYWSISSQTSAAHQKLLVTEAFDDPDLVTAFVEIVKQNLALIASDEVTLHTEDSLRVTLEAAGFRNISVTSTYAGQAWLAVAT